MTMKKNPRRNVWKICFAVSAALCLLTAGLVDGFLLGDSIPVTPLSSSSSSKSSSSSSSAFTPRTTRSSSRAWDDALSSNSRLHPPRRHFAIIYGENGDEVIGEDEDQGNADNSNTLPSISLESLTAQVDPTLLTRVACAFAPPPRSHLHPNDVQSATLVSVERGPMSTASSNPQVIVLQVALAIPQDKNSNVCVQLLVPISLTLLPLSISTDNNDIRDILLEEQIIAALQALEDEATAAIRSQEVIEDQTEQLADQASLLRQLEEAPYADSLPDWWTWVELNQFLDEECTTLKSLLNEDDFATDLQQLARAYFSNSSSSSLWKKVVAVRHARVAMVGPAGLFLRAWMEIIDDDEDDDASSSATTTTSIVEVPIPFLQPAKTADELRASVLDLVESVVDQREQVEEPAVEEPAVEEPAKLPASVESSSFTEKEFRDDDSYPLPSSSTTSTSTSTIRQQPKSAEQEAQLAAKYAAIEDIGERAYCILMDLEMI